MLNKIPLLFTKYEPCQRFLANIVRRLQYWMGVGSGTSIINSGESVIIQKLNEQYKFSDNALTIFDVGANKGQFIQMVLKNIDRHDIQIHAFEPANETYELLTDQFRDHANIKLNNIGLGLNPGTHTLYYDKPGSGLASLTKRRLDHFNIDFKYSEKIETDTLDHYCATNQIDCIHLLKLDVEGHELDVLKGATKLFENNKIEMVTFEFGGCNIDTRIFFQDFYYFFYKHGMDRIYRLTPSGYLIPIKKYREEYEQFRTSIFLVF